MTKNAAPSREDRLFYRQAEVARLLGVSPQFVAECIRKKEIKSARIGKVVLIPATEIDQLLQSAMSPRDDSVGEEREVELMVCIDSAIEELSHHEAADTLEELRAIIRSTTAILLEAYPSNDSNTCRQCGCTDDECSGCMKRTGEPCYWVEPDLCSACAGVPV